MHKLEDNGLWESSRMMLPEHKERIITQNNEILNQPLLRPVLDEQEHEQIMQVLMESFGLRITAEFRLFHEYEDLAVIGVVDRVDPYMRTFLVDGERFKVEDIIGASIIGS